MDMKNLWLDYISSSKHDLIYALGSVYESSKQKQMPRVNQVFIRQWIQISKDL